MLLLCFIWGGTHAWIWEGALRLRSYKTQDESVELLLEATSHCDHGHRAEIIDAVRNAYASAYAPRLQIVRPKADHDLVNQIVSTALVTVKNLASRSAHSCSELLSAEYYLGALFPANSWICAGPSADQFHTERYDTWGKDKKWTLSACSFVVPSPMSGPCGRKQNSDQLSQKTNANTGPRHYAVLEWDFDLEGPWTEELSRWHNAGLTTFDCCTSLIAHVAKSFPLSMAVSSASKSVHGWWYCQDWPPEKLRTFHDLGRTLGCDPHLEVLSQFTRMPAGWNYHTETRQRVHYLDLSTIK
jgi:hypothetical protein